jgi:hypothetical protein
MKVIELMQESQLQSTPSHRITAFQFARIVNLIQMSQLNNTHILYIATQKKLTSDHLFSVVRSEISEKYVNGDNKRPVPNREGYAQAAFESINF